MSTPPLNQGFIGTPGFQLYRRGLIVQTIKRFRGLNAYLPLTQVTPDQAIDLLNVIVSSSGQLSKLRLPINLSPAVGVNVGPFSFWDFQQGIGTRQVFSHFGSKLFYFTNDLANQTLIEDNQLNVPAWSFVAANNILFGANGNRMQKWTGTAWQPWGIVASGQAPLAAAQGAGQLSPATGYQWKYAYKNSVTGHVGNASPASVTTGPGATFRYKVTALAPVDSQVDTIVWFRNFDGGGDFFRLAEVVLATGIVTFNGATVTATDPGNVSIIDNTLDTALDQTIRAPLINFPPPQGTYVALAQGRIFVAGLAGAGSDAVYSGYEQIVLGRPEESFPLNNRLRISIGAESVVGLGPLHGGMVFFSNTGRMWMLRGAIEDITLNAPVAFSDVLEELPWTLGCLSHYSIQQTPYGLVWLAGDKTVQFWDGRSAPIDISAPVYPILRSITPGTERQVNGAYFNWLERDWYALTCATNGSLTPNTIIFWSLDAQSSNIDIFISNLATNWLGVVSTSKLQRKLLMSNGGRIAELPVRAVDQSGLVTDFTTYPVTAGNLRAYWRSGYFGNEDAYVSKLYRWTRFVPDRGAASYQVQARFVDDTNTIDAARIVGPVPANQARVPLNQRGYRCSVELDFPEQDIPCNVMELQLAYIGTSQR